MNKLTKIATTALLGAGIATGAMTCKSKPEVTYPLFNCAYDQSQKPGCSVLLENGKLMLCELTDCYVALGMEKDPTKKYLPHWGGLTCKISTMDGDFTERVIATARGEEQCKKLIDNYETVEKKERERKTCKILFDITNKKDCQKTIDKITK